MIVAGTNNGESLPSNLEVSPSIRSDALNENRHQIYTWMRGNNAGIMILLDEDAITIAYRNAILQVRETVAVNLISGMTMVNGSVMILNDIDGVGLALPADRRMVPATAEVHVEGNELDDALIVAGQSSSVHRIFGPQIHLTAPNAAGVVGQPAAANVAEVAAINPIGGMIIRFKGKFRINSRIQTALSSSAAQVFGQVNTVFWDRWLT